MKIIKGRSTFFRNTLTLLSGTVIAQAIPILLSPVLSRIYTTEDFAILAIITPFITIGAIIANLRLDIALVIPKEDDEARKLMSLALLFNLLTVLLSVIGVFIFNFFFSKHTFFSESAIKLLWYIPAGIFALGWYTAFNYWSTRNKTYKNNATSKIVQSVINISVCIIFGYFKPGAEGLVLGLVLGYILGLCVLIFKHKNNFPISFKINKNRKKLKDVLVKYKNFIFINTPHASIGTFVDQGIVYFLKIFFPNNIIGAFSFGYRYTKAPLGIITSSLSQVFYEDAAKKANEGIDIRPLMFKIQKNLFIFSFPFYIIGLIWAPEIFSFVFSAEYYTAGEVASLLLPWIYLSFLVSPFSSVTLIFNKQKESFLLCIIDLVLRITAVILGGISGDWTITFYFLSFICSIYHIFVAYWYYRISNPNKINRY
ncbi:MAG: oligosaccharide flippase family protein [Bacteroidales bacterium]|nr:oligosaccharide flippase family protein [Bacteroidales bacterium]